jgi:hypothetical protein
VRVVVVSVSPLKPGPDSGGLLCDSDLVYSSGLEGEGVFDSGGLLLVMEGHIVASTLSGKSFTHSFWNEFVLQIILPQGSRRRGVRHHGSEHVCKDASMTRKVRKRIKNTPNPQARRPRAAHGQGVAAGDVTSESEEDEEEGVECGRRMYGVRMSPAHPRYVGRGDDTCGEVVYTIPEIRTLLHSQPEDTKRWLTTSQMGWALTREENEVIMKRTNARVNRWREN